jgi:hypothetical protein
MLALLIWLFLTLFSVVGYLGIIEYVEDVFGNSDAVQFSTYIINFYASNLLAVLLFRNYPIVLINRVMLLVATGIGLLIGEFVLIWFIIYRVFDMEVGFWSVILFFFSALILLMYGGVRQILMLILNDMQTAVESSFDGLQKNLINQALEKNKKNTPSKVSKMRDIDKEIKELEDYIKKNS